MRIIFINFAIFIKESKLFIKDKSVSKRRFHKREKKYVKVYQYISYAIFNDDSFDINIKDFRFR